MQIPREILTDYNNRKAGVYPILTLRALTDLQNHLGETYLLGDQESCVLYSGGFTEPLEIRICRYIAIVEATATRQDPFLFLEIRSDECVISLKFASDDEPRINSFLAFWQHAVEQDSSRQSLPDQPPLEVFREADSPAAPQLDAIAGFSAVLHAMVYIDDECAVEELQDLQLILKNKDIIEKGRQCWKYYGTPTLLAEVAPLFSPEQKACLFANMIELAMIDGKLKTEEIEFLEFVRNVMDVDQAAFDNIFTIMLAKNDMSVFFH